MAALGFMEVTLIGGEAYLRDDHVAPRDLRGGSPSFSVSLRSGETLRGVAQRASLPTVYNVQIRGCAGEISPRPVFGGFGFMVHPDKHGAPECAFFARSVWSFGLYER